MSILQRVQRWLQQLENIILVLLLTAMLSLGVLQILLRNIFDFGLSWLDPLLRIMLFWLVMIAALVASRSNHHITIDILSRLLPPNWHHKIQSGVYALTSLICGVLAWYTAHFVLAEHEFLTYGILGIPNWCLMLIMPISFTLMALRYLLMAFQPSTPVPPQILG